MKAELVPFYLDEGLEIAFWRNVVVLDVAAEVTLPRAQAMGRAYRALLADHPRGVVGFSMIRAGVPVSSPEARGETMRFINELGASVLVLVLIVEDSGIFAQMMRTAIRGLNVLMRSSKMLVFADVDEAATAAARFVTHAGESVNLADQLRQVIHAHRRQSLGAPPLRRAR